MTEAGEFRAGFWKGGASSSFRGTCAQFLVSRHVWTTPQPSVARLCPGMTVGLLATEVCPGAGCLGRVSGAILGPSCGDCLLAVKLKGE